VGDYETRQSSLDDLIGWLAENDRENRNEASTSFHLIDRLVKQALTWPPEDVEVEVRAGS